MKHYLAVILISTAFMTALVYAETPVSEQRLDNVAELGAKVMPFDLEKTVHIFSKTPTGGVQQVVVKDKNDNAQIQLIREHLSKIADEFKRGDFSNPEKIHGRSMPGLAELKKAKAGEITVDYQPLAEGGQITYSTQSSILIIAIHQWFSAQLSDHARHAIEGHAAHTMHHQ
ncbi:MAG: aspartate carbamoyltransferase [Methylococcaceae bacterium]|nr:aspartate carbamoyltransferase [Methylococcaceae bacterium]MDD1610383.1 aspartate carbamoyltransferase [Methylococcaceae bacterium]MDD1616180.1 aspartate carbamoyltransferase [Methylococcaceae bacterium]OYV18372.1 MAG: cytochrome c family protein [Methylococcaceae bacterium NSP1-2]